MPYNEHVQGAAGINYAAERLTSRAPSGRGSFTSFGASGAATSTPLLEAFEGDAVRIHVLVASGEQPHVFTVEGHRWEFERGLVGTNLVSSRAIGPLEAWTVELLGGAGPAGDYVYGDHREPYRAAGLWGLLRIHAGDTAVDGLRRLPPP
jgi:manganese oxidase